MSRPVPHSKTGIYQLRKRVPDHLIEIVGKREVKISLKTRDPHEAKIVHATLLAEIEARWRQLSKGEISLTQKQAVAMAGEIYRSMIAEKEDDPGRAASWKASMILDQFFFRPEVKLNILCNNFALYPGAYERAKATINDKTIKAYLSRNGYRLDEPSVTKLRAAVAEAVLQAKEHLARLAKGDYRPDPDADRFPQLEMDVRRTQAVGIEARSEDIGKYALMKVFEDYVKERKPAASTYKSWKGKIAQAANEVPDIRDLSAEWVIDWKDDLLGKGLSATTVKDGYLAALRTVCGWAKDNKRISANPVDGITVAVPRQAKTRKKYFTDQEASTILKAALGPPPATATNQMKSAYRWVPWLCAYTGARVGEMTQLRKEDVISDGGHWMIHITPEAGSTKDSNERDVAIHPHLIEQGFLEFVRRSKSGPLFYDPTRSRGGSDGNPQYKKVGERLAAWVRNIGVTDTRIQPNHAWRHLFKTEARSGDMDSGARDYMQGHVPATEGEAYGGYKPHVLVREISKMPRFEV